MSRTVFAVILLSVVGIGVVFLFASMPFSRKEQKNETSRFFGTNVEEIVALGKWYADSSKTEKYTYVAKKTKSGSKVENDGLLFVIFDDKGKEVYKLGMKNLDTVFTKFAVEQNEQLFFSYDDGARLNSLRGLAFKDGKIVELMEHPVYQNEIPFDGYFSIVPLEFDSRVAPKQIFVTDMHGTTSIYRYKGGKFRLHGSIDGRRLQELIEELTERE